MQKLIKKIIVLALLIYQANSCYAQVTDSVLHHYYWNYRERYKKYFTTIGKEQGQSVVCAKIANGQVVYSEPYKIKVNTNGKREREFINNDDYKNYQYHGYADFGDATLSAVVGVITNKSYYCKYI